MKLFKISAVNSNFNKAKSFSDIPKGTLFVKFVYAVHDVLLCNFLAKKMKRWYNKNPGQVEKDFSFRFRGKESYLYMQHFPEMINVIYQNVSDIKSRKRLSQIWYQSIKIREALSYSVRIEDFNENDLEQMEKAARELFIACCLFYQRMSPSLWTLCNVAPYHAKQCLKLHGLGLGCNTMEGREQKHQVIAKYANNTTFQNKWPMIFRHEFVQLIMLRENGFDDVRYRKRGTRYIPPSSDKSCLSCFSVYHVNSENKLCRNCDSDHFKEVVDAVKKVY